MEKQIKTTDYVHPLDYKLKEKILNNSIVKKAIGVFFEQKLDDINRYIYSATNVCVDNIKPISTYLIQSCKLFDISEVPNIYLYHSYQFDIKCLGYDNPVMVIPDILLKNADDSILYGRIASAVASIVAEHNKLEFLIWIMENFTGIIGIPFASTAIRGMLYEWSRAQFYTTDRAFLLATKNYELSLKNILFGEVPMDTLSNFSFGNNDTFDKQVQDFYRKEKITDIISVINNLTSCEVWIPARYKELKEFYNECRGEL